MSEQFKGGGQLLPSEAIKKAGLLTPRPGEAPERVAVLELLPCPFCGSHNIGVCEGEDRRYDQMMAVCHDCDAEGPNASTSTTKDGDAQARAEAARLWNERAKL